MAIAPTLAVLNPSLSPFSGDNPKIRQTNHDLPPISLLRRCSSLRELKQIHAAAVKSELRDDISIFTKLVSSCAMRPSLDSMEYAHNLFDQIPHPDVALFNAMARGYARTPTPLRACQLLVRMLHLGVLPDGYTFPSLLKACAISKASKQGRQIHSLAARLGLHHNIFVHPTLINLYAECNDLAAARRLFDRIPSPCVISYNAMISAYARSNLPNEALALFRQLQTARLTPTDATMLGVLSSCALLGALDLGKWAHDYIRKRGGGVSVRVSTALIDMYAKCGSVEDAAKVFDEMSHRDTQAWSAMIMASAIHGQAERAITLFEEMKRTGIQPDGITLLGVLYACSHAGKVDEGRRYFSIMREDHGIVPSVKHIGCMVDLLGRAGLLSDAYEFLRGGLKGTAMVKPTPILWRTLLSACSIHGDVQLGERVTEHIFDVDVSHGGDYVILSNMYAAKGRWEDASRVRKLMKDRGAAKVPGCSSIEAGGVVHEFFSGDRVQPQSGALQRMVDEVAEQLKVMGYMPDTSVVAHSGMCEQMKETSLRYHSEKMAIVYGLMNTPPGATIRVVKNLRMCRDCHSAAKHMSLMFKRRIIVRDVQRFHHFEDGACSCGDYW